MDILDVFNDDAFKVTSLTLAMREVIYTPSYVGKLGLFQTESVDTLDIAIEKDAADQVFLVSASPRGAPGQTFGHNRRSMRKLGVPHFQVDDALYADSLQGKREFGLTMARETIQSAIAKRAFIARRAFTLTEEYHRLALITQGKLLDTDGSTIYDYFSEMGESAPTEIDFDLDNASPAKAALRDKCDDIWRAMGTTLDGLPFTGIIALCGDAFFKDLVKHKEVYDLYLAWSGAATLQKSTVDATRSANASIWGELEFGNIRWVNYRGGQSVGINTDKCYFVPFGVPDLFKTVYAPADYMDTVNTMGQALYANQWRMPNNKGVNLEFQSNVLHYCTRPRVLMSGRRT
jgi:hypothetical protein